GNSPTPSNPPTGSSAAATCMSAWVSTPPVTARVSSTMVNAIPFLWLKGWHAPAGRRTCEPRPLAQDGQIRPARRWVPQKPGTRPTDRFEGQPKRRQPNRRSGRDPGHRPYARITAKPRKQGVHGHEKVPVCGQVQVPGCGQLKVPIPSFRRVCRVSGSRAVTVAVPPSHRTARELLLKSARERMDIIAAYREAGTFRGAAEIAGTTHKTVRRVIARHEAGGAAPVRAPRGRNYDGVAALVAERVGKTSGRISAKRLLPAARAAGYAGSDWNFRRVVAGAEQAWRREHHRG